MNLQQKSYALRLRVLEMMHIGEKPVFSKKGLVTSLAWGMEGKVDYVLEGNINYTGAVTQVGGGGAGAAFLLQGGGPGGPVRRPRRHHLSGPRLHRPGGALLGDSGAKGHALRHEPHHRPGGNRQRPREECIAYQIADVLELMGQEAGVAIQELRVDGGPTKDKFLMQFQSDILNLPVAAPEREDSPAWGRPSARASRRGCTARKFFKPCAEAVSCPAWRRRCAGKRERAGSRRLETLLTRPGTK